MSERSRVAGASGLSLATIDFAVAVHMKGAAVAVVRDERADAQNRFFDPRGAAAEVCC